MKKIVFTLVCTILLCELIFNINAKQVSINKDREIMDQIEIKAIVDRKENGYIVCECDSGRMVSFAKAAVPKNIREGDAVRVINGSMYLDSNTTRKNNRIMEALIKELWK